MWRTYQRWGSGWAKCVLVHLDFAEIETMTEDEIHIISISVHPELSCFRRLCWYHVYLMVVNLLWGLWASRPGAGWLAGKAYFGCLMIVFSLCIFTINKQLKPATTSLYLQWSTKLQNKVVFAQPCEQFAPENPSFKAKY